MIRLIAGGILMIVMTYIGIRIDRFYKERLQLFKNINAFFEYTSREIKFLKTDIITITKGYAGSNSELGKILLKIASDIEQSHELSVETLYFNEVEKGIIINFFNNIKTADTETTNKLFEMTESAIEDRIKLAERQKKEKGELIKKLMALAGIGLMIVVA